MTRRRCSGGKIWEVPFVEEFGLLGCRCHRNGKGTRGTEGTLVEGCAHLSFEDCVAGDQV